MKRKKIHQAKVETQVATGSESMSHTTPQPKSKGKWLTFMKKFPYILSFLLLWFFCSITYGDVFTRTVQESFVCSDTNAMKFLTDQENGQLYVFGRYLLLIFHNPWLGGFLFSLILTAMAALLDRAFRLPLWLRGFFTIAPFALIATFMSEGIKIYYKSEPSLFVLQTLAAFIIAIVLGTTLPLLLKRFVQASPTLLKGWRKVPFGMLTTLVGFGALQGYASTISCENTILTARMQNRILENDLVDLVTDGLSAQQPTRSVAAYYAVGLLHTDQILEHIFDISFHFPDIHLNEDDGSGEYGIFQSDCDFYSGLINPSYRSAMDQIVMNGPRLYYLKRMAICAILNNEPALAQKYFTIIGKVPFEKDFVKKYRPYSEDYNLVKQDPIFKKVLDLKPVEHYFEQNYRNPTFLGYYVGMLQGNADALMPSIAACLYSKDLANVMQRAIQLKQFNLNIPLPLMEAIYIFSRKNPAILQYFPELSPDRPVQHAAVTNVNNFFITIQTHYQNKYNGSADWRTKMAEDLHAGISEELRAELAPIWIGHYVYYYYCENIVMKEEKKQEKSGVN